MNENLDDPIATYRESRFEVRRQIELYPDRVRVTGKARSIGQFDTTIPLIVLRAEPGRCWIRGQLYRYGRIALIWATIWSLCLLILRGPELFLVPWVAGVLGSMTLIGLLLCLTNIRPTEYVQFQNDVGVVILDVGRVGPQAAEFDDFVSILIDRIREARST